MKIRKLAALLAVSALALTACSTVATEPDQTALHYEAGAFSATKFADCVNPSERFTGGASDKYYIYPTGSVRTYDASEDKAAEAPPITVVTKDNVEMKVPASVGLDMLDDCPTVRKFHETIGNRYKAYWGGTDFPDENEDSIPDGWITFLNYYVGKQLDITLDREAQGVNWRDLWNNPEVKRSLDQAVNNSLQTNIDAAMGGHFFNVGKVTIAKPDPASKDLKDAVAAEQAAVAKAKAIEVEAAAKENAAASEAKAAQAQVAVAEAKARVKAAEQGALVKVWGEDAIKIYAIDKGVSPWPNPVVAGQAATPKP